MAKRNSKGNTKFKKSQRAHLRLNRFYAFKENSAKNRAYANYHADCIERQERRKSLLSKKERRSLFFWWCKHEGHNPAR